MLRQNELYCIINKVKKDTEDITLITKFKVRLNVINGVNCK